MYGEGQPTVIPRPCDRCGAGNMEYAGDETIMSPLCAEVQIAFGLIGWLCHDCRKNWHTYIKNHSCHRKIMQAQLELEYWRSMLRAGSSTLPSLEEGKRLMDRVEDLELEANEIANRWMIGS